MQVRKIPDWIRIFYFFLFLFFLDEKIRLEKNNRKYQKNPIKWLCIRLALQQYTPVQFCTVFLSLT